MLVVFICVVLFCSKSCVVLVECIMVWIIGDIGVGVCVCLCYRRCVCVGVYCLCYRRSIVVFIFCVTGGVCVCVTGDV